MAGAFKSAYEATLAAIAVDATLSSRDKSEAIAEALKTYSNNMAKLEK